MKNIIQIAILVLITSILNSCSSQDEPDVDPIFAIPTITNLDSSENTGSFFLNRNIRFNISLVAQGFLDKLVITRNDIPFDEVIYTAGGERIFEFLVPVEDDWLGSSQVFSFVLFDKKGQISEPYIFTAEISDLVPTFEIVDELINGIEFKRLTGNVNIDETLTADVNWIIDGIVNIEDAITLTIEPGTKIYANSNETRLVILLGGKLMAEGTAELPIVFAPVALAPGQEGTANPGDWIGISVTGNSTLNSGIYKYVRIEYAGNGTDAFRMTDLSALTTVEFVQVFQSADNGVRVNGGDVNLKYIVGTNNLGAGIRYGTGWTGLGQFWISNFEVADGVGLQGRDNGSNPTLSNITISGPGLNGQEASGEGIRLRNSAIGAIYNTVISGVDTSFRMSNGSEDFIPTGDIIFKNNASFGNVNNSGTGFHSTANFYNPTSDSYIESNNNSVVPFSILESYIGTSTTNSVDASSLNSFFENVNYIGAVETGQDWTIGWTRNIDGSIR